MTHCLFKLEFSTPVHFGAGDYAHSVESCRMNFAADTLFSALCNIAVKSREIDRLVGLVRERKLSFSDSFPCKGDEFWLPKPMLTPKIERSGDPSARKKLKKLAFIPASGFSKYIASLSGKDGFDPDSAINDFGSFIVTTKAAIGPDEAEPYSVETFRFNEDCGLWFAVGYESREDVRFAERLVRLLGLGGIGGKVSSGYGKFTLTEVIKPDTAKGSAKSLLSLIGKNGGRYMTLTTACAEDRELDRVVEGAEYQLVRRGGYAYSEKSDRIMKKQTGYLFASGSTFTSEFDGGMPDVGISMPHPVWRYGIPIFIGVDY